jgi:hypothetical protein
MRNRHTPAMVQALVRDVVHLSSVDTPAQTLARHIRRCAVAARDAGLSAVQLLVPLREEGRGDSGHKSPGADDYDATLTRLIDAALTAYFAPTPSRGVIGR